MQVGVQLPEVERDVRWPEYLTLERTAEEVGLDSIWLGDHLLYRSDGRQERGPWEAWTLLAALAAATERVRLGPLVACASFHPPGLIAKMAATIDEISSGRFVLGLGAGWNETEYRAFGLPTATAWPASRSRSRSSADWSPASGRRSAAVSGKLSTPYCYRRQRDAYL
jgi:alkanesulfonate monooxygenase SsuD/methylene tetrahydromethanopterin reductase-like flavin-dependent oxidoreductase (luciferase family)